MSDDEPPVAEPEVEPSGSVVVVVAAVVLAGVVPLLSAGVPVLPEEVVASVAVPALDVPAGVSVVDDDPVSVTALDASSAHAQTASTTHPCLRRITIWSRMTQRLQVRKAGGCASVAAGCGVLPIRTAVFGELRSRTGRGASAVVRAEASMGSVGEMPIECVRGRAEHRSASHRPAPPSPSATVRRMTPDLLRLQQKLPELSELAESLELELVDDPAWAEPSDTGYLTAEERNDPDIMANVEAMTATNGRIAWFGRDMEGYLGLWRGAEDTPLERAPVVRLDSEGQYDLVAATIADSLVISADADEFDTHRASLVAAGFTVAATPDAIWDALSPFDSPNDHRHALYLEARKRRGLGALAD